MIFHEDVWLLVGCVANLALSFFVIRLSERRLAMATATLDRARACMAVHALNLVVRAPPTDVNQHHGRPN